MNLSGILVVTRPDRLEHCAERLATLPGVDVHIKDASTGRLIVTQEAASVAEEVDGLKRIKALPDVVMAEMVYHYFPDQSPVDQVPPRNLDSVAGMVPARLRDE
jgi:nitrate reductase NapD